jgi:DNA-binding CsgD family transcriptional regulator
MLNGSHFDMPYESPPYKYAVQKLRRLQDEMVATARTWAMGEIGAAVAHQLNDPLTALLIYLHEIEGASGRLSVSEVSPLLEVVVKAICEAERVCGIVDRIGHGVETPVETRSAVAVAREAIDTWAQDSKKNGGDRQLPLATSLSDHLTGREREVLAQIVAGASNKRGSHHLGISARTFEVHRAHIMTKLGARNAADLVRMVLEEVK